MENLQDRIIKGFNVAKSSALVFLCLCLASSLISVYLIPFLIRGSMTDDQINQELNQLSTIYGGTLSFSTSQIFDSIISFFNLAVVSTILVIAAYIVKGKIDKRLFRASKWRDWRFLLYISGISLIIIDIFQKALSTGDFIGNLLITIIMVLITIIFSAVLLPEEPEEIKMDI